MIKKCIMTGIIILCFVLFTGCRKDSDSNKDQTMPNGSDEIQTSIEPSEEPSEEPTQEPEISPIVEGNGDEDSDQVKDPDKLSSAEIDGIAQRILGEMTLDQKIGQLFIVNLEQLDTSNGSFYEWQEETPQMKERLGEYPVGGVVFFARNIATRDQTINLVDSLQTDAQLPLFVSVDEEGGQVSRIASNTNMGTTLFPNMKTVGEMDDETYTNEMGQTIGREIKELGFNLNFAPVADVLTNPENTAIGDRSFGDSPKLVAKMVKQVVEGIQSQQVSATLKHFPGQGAAPEDSHNGSVSVNTDLTSLRKVEFVPFKEGIKAGVDFIMVSHISISKVTQNVIPSSMSSIVMKDMLRTELGFEGIIITDALDMKAITDQYTPQQAAVSAILAGTDMLLMPEDYVKAFEGIRAAVEKEDLELSRLEESVLRILRTKIKRGIIPSNFTFTLDE